MNRVIEYIYISDLKSVCDISLLQCRNINAIISLGCLPEWYLDDKKAIHKSSSSINQDESIISSYVNNLKQNMLVYDKLLDSPEEPILSILHATYEFLCKQVELKNNVVVHCVYGQSRSAVVILYYLVMMKINSRIDTKAKKKIITSAQTRRIKKPDKQTKLSISSEIELMYRCYIQLYQSTWNNQYDLISPTGNSNICINPSFLSQLHLAVYIHCDPYSETSRLLWDEYLLLLQYSYKKYPVVGGEGTAYGFYVHHNVPATPTAQIPSSPPPRPIVTYPQYMRCAACKSPLCILLNKSTSSNEAPTGTANSPSNSVQAQGFLYGNYRNRMELHQEYRNRDVVANLTEESNIGNTASGIPFIDPFWQFYRTLLKASEIPQPRPWLSCGNATASSGINTSENKNSIGTGVQNTCDIYIFVPNRTKLLIDENASIVSRTHCSAPPHCSGLMYNLTNTIVNKENNNSSGDSIQYLFCEACVGNGKSEQVSFGYVQTGGLFICQNLILVDCIGIFSDTVHIPEELKGDIYVHKNESCNFFAKKKKKVK